jgi:hypothetical protein
MSLILTIVLVLGASAGAVVAYDRLVVAPLREQLKNPLVDRALLEEVLKAARAGGATPERPVVITVAPQGAPPSVQPVPVTVTLQPPPTAQPGQPPAQPRLVADSPPVFCRTQEECDRIYARVPQALTVDAQVRAGTVVTVCLDQLDAEGRCPEGRRANLPLAEPVKFTAQFVLAERGVFQGLNVVGAPLEITRVRTETPVEAKIKPPPLPYHLAAFIRGGLPGGDLTAGLRYVNRLGRGFYEVEAAMRWDPARPPAAQVIAQGWFSYILPLR